MLVVDAWISQGLNVAKFFDQQFSQVLKPTKRSIYKTVANLFQSEKLSRLHARYSFSGLRCEEHPVNVVTRPKASKIEKNQSPFKIQSSIEFCFKSIELDDFDTLPKSIEKPRGKKQKSIAKPKANYQKENYTFEKMCSAVRL